MGPILRHVFEPDPTPFCEVPVKLPPSPVKRHFGMGPIFGLRFLPTTGPRAQVRSDSSSVPGRARSWGIARSISFALEDSATLVILRTVGRRD